MKITHVILVMTLILLSTSCSAGMTGTVVDAETGKPIEGAVVHVEWTKTKGIPGLTYRETYKIAEAVTDKEGNFSISKFLRPPVNPPTVVVYKRGYVAWRNDFIFPDYRRREDFKWTNNIVVKLEHFKKYSHSQHISFIRTSLSLTTSSKLDQAFSPEIIFAEKERDLYSKSLDELKQGKKTERQIWQEIIDALYSHQGEKNE